MRMFVALSVTVLLFGCANQAQDKRDRSAFDFGGVFDGTVAGQVDRTVAPRRPDGPPNVVLIIADDWVALSWVPRR